MNNVKTKIQGIKYHIDPTSNCAIHHVVCSCES